MQILIEIDKETLQDLYDSRYVSPHIKEALRTGIPLPKGHGKLVDLDQMCADYWDGNYMEIHSEDLKNIKTIIETDTEDKEQEEERV